MNVGQSVNSIPEYNPEKPKYVDKSNAVDDLQTNFLTLLTTQLQYQDPLKPMENAEFTSQMAQFSMIGQQQASNKLLEQLLTAQTSDQVNQAVGYLGRQVVVEGSQMVVAEGEGTVRFSLPEAAAVGVSVYNQQGERVKWIEPEAFGAGENAITFSDHGLSDGVYTFAISALNADEEVVDATHLTDGVVQGVVRGDDGVMLDLGRGRQVAVYDIRRVDG